MSLTEAFTYLLVFLAGVIAGRVWRYRAGSDGGRMVGPGAVNSTTTPAVPQVDAETVEEIRALVSRGNFIQAIKLYRERTGAGLKESKEAVEAIMLGMER